MEPTVCFGLYLILVIAFDDRLHSGPFYVIMFSAKYTAEDKGKTGMGKRAYLKLNPKQKRPKDHEVICDGGNIYYPRTGTPAQIKETPTTGKIRNLFYFSLEADGEPDQVDPESFCEMRQISLSNFRRLLAIMLEYYGICSEDGNTYQDTPTNRKYLALLALHDRLEDGVDMQKFCSEFHIGRTTFFRYLAIVEDFYFHFRGGDKVIALLGDGKYIGVYPGELGD